MIRSNTYMTTLFNRLETKVINTGLTLNASPLIDILSNEFGFTPEGIRKWSRTVESYFLAWANEPEFISWNKRYSFNRSQKMGFRTALLSGDFLTIVTLNKIGLPVFKLVDSAKGSA